ncbi:MAG: hypothetical protein Q8P88_02300 [Candidatus Jorgensenbacteria bacterium]|nr:hypothetical protein [Candidatus Jorgensenbacteria bacterium]
MFLHVHYYAWLAAALTGAFLLELAGVFRVGEAGLFVSFIFILLAGFFGIRWFAGLYALLLLTLSFFMAPFWVFEVGGMALVTLLLLLAAPFLTGRRFVDFMTLLGAGTLILVVGGSVVRGGGSLETVLISLLLNGIVGAVVFYSLDSFFPVLHTRLARSL